MSDNYSLVQNIDYKGDGENLLEAIAKESSSDTDFQVDDKSDAEESADEKEVEDHEVTAEANGLVESEKKVVHRGTLSQNNRTGKHIPKQFSPYNNTGCSALHAVPKKCREPQHLESLSRQTSTKYNISHQSTNNLFLHATQT